MPAKPQFLPARPQFLPAKPQFLPAKPPFLPAKPQFLPAKPPFLPAQAPFLAAYEWGSSYAKIEGIGTGATVSLTLDHAQRPTESGPERAWVSPITNLVRIWQRIPWLPQEGPTADVDAATQNQIRNIETSTGRSMDEWVALVGSSGRSKFGEIVAWLKTQHGMSHGNANLVALIYLRGPAAPAGDDLVDAIYSGPKAGLRAFHDQVWA